MSVVITTNISYSHTYTSCSCCQKVPANMKIAVLSLLKSTVLLMTCLSKCSKPLELVELIFNKVATEIENLENSVNLEIWKT